MSKKFSRHTITAALPYANGPIHIGHLAGVYIPADIYARYLRMKGEDVVFVCGSDEHGVPITIRAKNENTTPQVIVDKYYGVIKQSFEELGITFDIFSRTSNEVHKETSSAFFKKLHKEGKFVEQTSSQYYDEKNQEFLADRYIKGTCPKCGYEEAYGDQCEKCGSTLSPNELINPFSAISGEKPIKKDTKHWYLPLDQYEGFLKKWILEDHKGDWKSNVYGQCKSWLDAGLLPRAVTRDLNWGVPVPVEGAEGKVLYVWFDAPIGYISATKEWAAENDKNWEDYWKKEDTNLVHFIGKDNIVFHCIIFPSMLKAHGDYILPQNVPANEFLNLEGNKLSTSRNWAVWLHEYLEDFPGKQDILRYALCSNAPEGKDNDFTWKDFQAKNNNELAANPGNFVNRTLTLTHKYYDGKVPARLELFDADKELIKIINEAPAYIGESIEKYRFREAASRLMELSTAGNKYLAETAPWEIAKTDPERVKTIIHLSLQLTANWAILASPFIPFSAEKLLKMLNISPFTWNEAGSDAILAEGHTINKKEILFSKIEDDEIQKQIDKLEKTKEDNAVVQSSTIDLEPIKETITFDDFMKMDLRIGTILEATKVPKTDKLLHLKVDIGSEIRTVVSGIAKSYDPENIIGQQVTLLANLAPRKIKGIESQGMILMGENEAGKLAFMGPDKELFNGGTIA